VCLKKAGADGGQNCTSVDVKGNGKTSWHYFTTELDTEDSFQEEEEWAVRVVGSGEKGAKIYLDDLSITPGPCPAPGNCDFEDGLGCGWSQDFQDDLDWLVVQADSPANLGGPIYDHTGMNFEGKLAGIAGHHSR
jgi:hypothetical protein